MSTVRLPLLCAFVAGCLSGAVVLGVWRADTAAAVPVQKQLARSNELLAAAIAITNAERGREVASREPSEAVTSSANAPARGRDASGAPSPASETEDLGSAEPASAGSAEPAPAGSAEPAPAGSAVSDVLMDLEAAYRTHLTPSAPAEAPSAVERPAIPAPTNVSTTLVEPPREVAVRAVATSATPAAAATPVVSAPAAIAPTAIAPPVEAASAAVAQLDPRPPDVHYGDINQNTYNITNVRQGDVYVMQQQLALLQYIQLLGTAASAGRANQVGPAHYARGAVPQAAPQYRQFPSTLTNPDNPWGFNFAPPNLVH
jgi:hypothetical protein